MNPTTTPRTDLHFSLRNSATNIFFTEDIEFVRRLERELAQAKAHNGSTSLTMITIQAELDSLKRELVESAFNHAQLQSVAKGLAKQLDNMGSAIKVYHLLPDEVKGKT